ncbi:MAG: GTPase Era [Lentisphaeraceae bacterium]|nr:GTPase Era [Lentisphaeraceae bacterium]
MFDINDGDWPCGSVGYVTIVGRPNVGKSTFLNQVLGYHLAAVSIRPNTTRKRWLGILSDDNSQIIFADTPGMHECKNKMHEAMEKTIKTSISKNDLVLCICDSYREFGEEDEMVASSLADCGKPVVLAVNKTDIAKKADVAEIKKKYLEHLGDVPVFEISAIKGENTEALLKQISDLLPQGPFMYPKDQVADAFMRDIAEEIIREAANELIFDEIPHALAVKIDKWQEGPKKLKIHATIYVERETQKAIVIGVQGGMVNKIKKSACEKLREDIEKFIDLKLYVKTAPDWQNKGGFLKDLGVVDDEG